MAVDSVDLCDWCGGPLDNAAATRSGHAFLHDGCVTPYRRFADAHDDPPSADDGSLQELAARSRESSAS